MDISPESRYRVGRAGSGLSLDCRAHPLTPCPAPTLALPRPALHRAGSGTSSQNPSQKWKSLTEASGRFVTPPQGRCH